MGKRSAPARLERIFDDKPWLEATSFRRLPIPVQLGCARRGSFCCHERALRPFLEALSASGEPLAPWIPVRPLPRALGLCHAPRRSLDRPRISSSRTLRTACAPPSHEPRGLGPNEPGYRCCSREKQCSSASRLHAVPSSGHHGRQRRNVSEPGSVLQGARARASGISGRDRWQWGRFPRILRDVLDVPDQEDDTRHTELHAVVEPGGGKPGADDDVLAVSHPRAATRAPSTCFRPGTLYRMIMPPDSMMFQEVPTSP